MKVAIIQETVDARRGGAETSTLEMARWLGAVGAGVTLLCRAEDPAAECAGPAPRPQAEAGVVIERLCAPGATRAARTAAFIAHAAEFCRAHRFDVVHAVTPCPAADVYQPRGGTYRETVLRSTALHPRWLRPLKRFGRLLNARQRLLQRHEEALFRNPERPVFVAALSDYVRRQVLRIGAVAERVRIVFNGVDVAALDPQVRDQERTRLHLPAEPPVVLFIAHNFPLKGLRELLRAQALSRSDWRLIVAGRDDARPYQQLAGRLGIAERVRFVGDAAPAAALYAAADAVAHPTWYDPCSRVVLEALALGVPVVTTRLNGAAEILEPARHGAVIDHPTDLAGLAAGVEYALTGAIRRACRAAAPEMRRRLSMERHARELLELYRLVAADAGARPRR